eukprot:gnl/TRDRNA2_/TRDRNA2_131794_c2_seq1.p1 gnl/TRDRNA2_/TRDRNA2_131794_c2~~gnl/TRDRNA2_/TRDRNA2_131794_c2_seq1.p1  ORF type:complete len:209 (-),score=37.87 gnl/TRDRNA2_/TRDRNA2_131794_c2_seq1:295-891(-)
MQVLAEKYKVTPSTLFFRFMMGFGIVPLTAAFSDYHMKQDLASSSVPLTSEDAAEIVALLSQENALLQSKSAENDRPSLPAGVSGKVSNLQQEEFLSAQQGNADSLIVIKFYAKWCRACKMMGPKVEKLAAEFPKVRFFEVDYDANKDFCKSKQIKTLPFFEIYRGANGKVDGFPCGPTKIKILQEKVVNSSKLYFQS